MVTFQPPDFKVSDIKLGGDVLDLTRAFDWAEKVARRGNASPSHVARGVGNLKDGIFDRLVIAPFHGKDAKSHIATIHKMIRTPGGKVWLRHFFPDGDAGTKAFKATLKEFSANVPRTNKIVEFMKEVPWWGWPLGALLGGGLLGGGDD